MASVVDQVCALKLLVSCKKVTVPMKTLVSQNKVLIGTGKVRKIFLLIVRVPVC